MKKITLLTVGLGIAFAAIPLVSFAQALTTSTPTCTSFSRSLSIGARGSDVTNLQTYLVAHDYLSVTPTGYFGPLTRAAVSRWQAVGGITTQGSAGSGIFGPLSRAYFARTCGSATTTFSANPQSGSAPLTVQFTSSAPQGSDVGSAVQFGDGTSGKLAFAPTCANCNALATVSHTYATAGTYIATLTSGNCTCPPTGMCNCPMIQVLATTTVVVGPVSSTADIEQVNAPANVTLSPNGIAEVRNESYYFTLENLTTNGATIQPTLVGCWNSFPSDPPPEVRCMIALVPIPPQTLSLGQSYQSGTINIALAAISNGEATFSIH